MRLHLAHVVVIGGGYVGQLVQLRIPSVRILDWRKTPPTNHLETRMGPQYLWEPIPGVESISFPVRTLVDGKIPTYDSILAYKRKIGKQDDGGDWGEQFRYKTTGWHSALPVPRVEYNSHVRGVDLSAHSLLMDNDRIISYDLLVNTIPLDFFLNLCATSPRVHYPWKQNPIYMSTGVQGIPMEEGMILNYLSDPATPTYRETAVPGKMFYESLEPQPSAVKIMPGKIHPHQESEDVLRSLRMFDVYCFGRFATWRPDELAHETWKHIDAWKGTYENE